MPTGLSTAGKAPHRSAGPLVRATRRRHCSGMHLGQPVQLLDLDRLEHLSRALAGAADELAGLRSALQSKATGLQWHSGAAQAFQAVLQELLEQLGQTGSRLTELSGAVGVHQQRAAGRAASGAQLAHACLDLLERAVRLP